MKSEFGWKLRDAAQNGNVEKVRTQLDVGTPIDCVSYSNGRSALHYAATAGQLAALTLLLGRGASLELVDSTGNTALHLAVSSRNAACVSVLLKNGADAFAHKNQKGKTAYALAQEVSGGVLESFSKVYDMGGDVAGGETDKAPKWKQDDATDVCASCAASFTLLKRRHHCRSCGDIFCKRCSGNTMPLPHLGMTDPVRVCDGCLATLKVPSDDEH